MTKTVGADLGRPRGWHLLRAALQTRKAATMLGFGFSSGLPFALLIGTLNAWLGEAKINLATIGVLSWIGLSYAFKFLWSPIVDRFRLPYLDRLGQRKSWIFLCQSLLVVSLLCLAAVDPSKEIGLFSLFALTAALSSATQDITIDAWRIDIADDTASVELLSAVYQFGYRIASIVGGAVALVLAARMAWSVVYLLMAMLMVAMVAITLRAPDSLRLETASLQLALSKPGEINARVRIAAVGIVTASWLWAILTIGRFMVAMLSVHSTGAAIPSVAVFTKTMAPWIVIATVIVPLIIAAILNRLKDSQRYVQTNSPRFQQPSKADYLYLALVAPLIELVERLGWGIIIIVGFILTYTFCYNVWSAFAFPFYLDYLHYSKDEVAFASKVFGIFMTMIGISLGGYGFAKLGRMPTILVGAVLPIFGNFVYADLAEGGAAIDAVADAIGLNAMATMVGSNARIVRLLLAISGENIATGIAGAAFIAYLSGVVSRRFTAVQYALLSSLTFLIGSLGRGIVGEGFDKYGYAAVFRYTALAGVVAVLFVLLEWARTLRVARINQAPAG